MRNKSTNIVKSILGDDFFEDLVKYEIYKPETKSVVDPGEIRIALEIVPRAVLSYLFENLRWREVGDIVELHLPFAPDSQLHVEKRGYDNYKGEIVKDNKRVAEFQHRSLPSIGLMLLTTFELYDLALLDEIKEPLPKETNDKVERLQDVIDQRLTLHKLVQDVVDRRISEREAVGKLIREKLNEHIEHVNSQKQKDEQVMSEKKSKLREFLESRERRPQETIELDKSEIKCPDCNTTLYKSENQDNIKLCICYGEFHNKDIKLTKADNNKVNLKFPKSFDVDNIEMLLSAIKGEF